MTSKSFKTSHYNIEIKTHDGKVWYLERRGKGVADWTPEVSRAMKFKTLNKALNAYGRTAKYAVCTNSCVNTVAA